MRRYPVRARILLPLWLLLLAGSGGAAGGQELDYGSLVIRTLPSLPTGKLHGYHELTFELTSLSDRPQRVTLAAPREPGRGTTTTIERLERTVEVPAGGRLHVSLHQPALRMAGHWLRVTIDGREQEPPLALRVHHPESWNASSAGPSPPRVLLTRGAHELGESRLSTGEKAVFVETNLSLAAWSSSWLAYSGWDGIVLTGREADEASDAVVDALVGYVSAGGTLWILGDRAPGGGEAEGGSDARLSRRWPTGDCGEHHGFRKCAVGLGWLVVSSVAVGESSITTEMPELWAGSMVPWTRTVEPTLPHSLLPVVDSVGVPVRLLFLLLVGFTVVVGPLNVLVLNRSGRRLWILATIPVISLVACGLLLAASLFGEGLIRERRSEGFTYLDQPARRATSYAWVGYYSTLVPRSGLLFDRTTEVTPFLDIFDWRQARKRPGKQVMVDPALGQRLTRGWMKARVPAYLVLRKHEPRRERLEVGAGPEGVVVVNGLGSDLRDLLLADELGRLWGLEVVPAGERAELEERDTLAQGGRGALRQLYREELPSRLQLLAAQPEKILRPGMYVAALASSPFLEPGLDDAEAKENLWLVGRWHEAGRSEGSTRVAEAGPVPGAFGPVGSAEATP